MPGVYSAQDADWIIPGADVKARFTGVNEEFVYDGLRWRRVNGAWIADDNGDLHRVIGYQGTTTVAAVPVGQRSIRITWTSPSNALQTELYAGGKLRHTATGPDAVAGSVTVTSQEFVPDTTVEVHASAKIGPGDYDVSTPVSCTLPPFGLGIMLTASNPQLNSYDLAWTKVEGGALYSVYNGANQVVLESGPDRTSYTMPGASPGTRYSNYVRATDAYGLMGPPSNTVSVTTKSAFPAGTYYFTASSCDTWQAAGSWRGSVGSDRGEVWHGDGGQWGASGGARTACFFGYRHANGQDVRSFFTSQGLPVNVTGFQVRVVRKNSSHGYYAAQLSRWWVHNHTSRPGGAPALAGGYDNGSLSRGQGAWVSLPAHWAQQWVDGWWHGIGWGNVGGRYMIGPHLNADPAMCQIAITVS